MQHLFCLFPEYLYVSLYTDGIQLYSYSHTNIYIYLYIYPSEK